MAEDYIKEPECGLLRFSPDELEYIRKKIKMYNKNDRENAIAIIYEWVKSEEHFVKKDFSKAYIERCILTCNGSLERAKKQIDMMCTFRTLMPHFFQLNTLKGTEMLSFVNEIGQAGVSSKLTKELHRLIVAKAKPNIRLDSEGMSHVLQCSLNIAEYIKSNDYCLGYHLVFDLFDTNASNVMNFVNLIQYQQALPIFSKGYGCKLKGLYLITNSIILEKIMGFFKSLFSDKMKARIHTITDRKLLKNFIEVDVLPADYGGQEKSVEQLNDCLMKSILSEHAEELLKEMNKAVVDESKRRTDKYNEQYMGLSGTFRTLTLD